MCWRCWYLMNSNYDTLTFASVWRGYTGRGSHIYMFGASVECNIGLFFGRGDVLMSIVSIRFQGGEKETGTGKGVKDSLQPMDGRCIKDYRIGGVIGEGRTSVVRECVHITTGEKVACKIISRAYIKTCSVDYVHKELHAMARLNSKTSSHPNVIRFYTAYQSQKRVWIFTELVEGRELFSAILEARGDRDWGGIARARCLKLFAQIVSAVGYMHSRRVAHGDLKPSNMMVTPDDTIKVVDFGFAHVAERDSVGPYRVQSQCGSPHYASPELYSGKPYDVFTSELWSLGVILFVMACGFLPFDGSSTVAIMHEVVKGVYEIPPDLDEDIADLIQQLVRVNPAHRLPIHRILSHRVFVGTPMPAFKCSPLVAELRHSLTGSNNGSRSGMTSASVSPVNSTRSSASTVADSPYSSGTVTPSHEYAASRTISASSDTSTSEGHTVPEDQPIPEWAHSRRFSATSPSASPSSSVSNLCSSSPSVPTRQAWQNQAVPSFVASVQSSLVQSSLQSCSPSPSSRVTRPASPVKLSASAGINFRRVSVSQEGHGSVPRDSQESSSSSSSGERSRSASPHPGSSGQLGEARHRALSQTSATTSSPSSPSSTTRTLALSTPQPTKSSARATHGSLRPDLRLSVLAAEASRELNRDSADTSPPLPTNHNISPPPSGHCSPSSSLVRLRHGMHRSSSASASPYSSSGPRGSDGWSSATAENFYGGQTSVAESPFGSPFASPRSSYASPTMPPARQLVLRRANPGGIRNSAPSDVVSRPQHKQDWKVSSSSRAPFNFATTNSSSKSPCLQPRSSSPALVSNSSPSSSVPMAITSSSSFQRGLSPNPAGTRLPETSDAEMRRDDSGESEMQTDHEEDADLRMRT
eukprot:g8158.t1